MTKYIAFERFYKGMTLTKYSGTSIPESGFVRVRRPCLLVSLRASRTSTLLVNYKQLEMVSIVDGFAFVNCIGLAWVGASGGQRARVHIADSLACPHYTKLCGE